VISGFLMKRSGRSWKRRWVTLDSDRVLFMAEKKGGAVKTKLQITGNTQVNALKEAGDECAFSITGTNHSPLYLKADSPELADGWTRALNIMKNGGTSTNLANQDRDKEATLRKVFVRGNPIARTLDRKKERKHHGRHNGSAHGRQNGSGHGRPNAPDRSAVGPPPRDVIGRPISFNPELIPPPPPSDEDMLIAPPASPGPPSSFASTYESSAYTYEDDEDDDDEDAAAGFMVHIDGRDYFVHADSWEYFESRDAFLDDEAPIGSVTLSLLV